MTIFAVMCAGLFPVIHMGRPWLFYWMFPYPNTRGPLWVNFRSPLVWDFFAIGTYFLDLADVLVRRACSRPGHAPRPGASRAGIGGCSAFFSLGWNGSYRTWHRYEVGLPAAGRAGDAAGGFGALRGQQRLRHLACCPAGTPPSSRRTSWPAPSSPAWPWC